ncbi:MAG: penicillin-binding protein 1A [Kiloniellales bacterium]
MRAIRVLGVILAVLIGTVVGVSAGGVWVLYYFGRSLPDYRQLAEYEPPIMTRVHAGDGTLLAEYATEKRVFVPIEAMPRLVIHAFLAAEDKNFYSHPGVDLRGVLRAVVTNLLNLGRDRRLVGASTITQQVAKNFLLSNEVSIQRKIKEAILAFRIERAIGKDRILELYLNEIYLGLESYGVAAAALNYFNKSLHELTVAEATYLAALPKAPNNYHPVHRYRAAIARRNWVIGRMVEDGHLRPEHAKQAYAQPLTVRQRDETAFVKADYFAEEVRRELVSQFGEEQLYKGGLSVRTTLDPRLQRIADRVLREGLVRYDRRHGWRGPPARIAVDADWASRLAAFELPGLIEGWRKAVVLRVDDLSAEVGLDTGGYGVIPLAEVRWARPWLEGQSVGEVPRSVRQVLAPGDVVMVEAAQTGEQGEVYPPDTYALRQRPAVDGAIVALDPHTGRVLAITGGMSYELSQFNRATQALRQPGSAFKPFVYLAALHKGYTPATLILDAPFVIDQGPGLRKWKPANYTKRFYGPSPMRIGIEKSRNLMTVRLAQTIGIQAVREYAIRLGVVDDMPPLLAMALGASETTLMRLTTAFAMLVNGGRRITPTLIDRVQERHGRAIVRHDRRLCRGCRDLAWRGEGQAPPVIRDIRERVADPGSAYQVVSMLEGAVNRGTGRRVRAVGKPLAGKTGTTNNNLDAWFIGFSPDLAVGVFVGFDDPATLGKKETGASVAAPIFRDFMAAALAGKPAIPFRVPPGIRLVRIDGASGHPARPGDRNVLLEAFKPGTEPRADQARMVLDGGYIPTGTTDPVTPTGGIY